jgi:hypothetical protein
VLCFKAGVCNLSLEVMGAKDWRMSHWIHCVMGYEHAGMIVNDGYE